MTWRRERRCLGVPSLDSQGQHVAPPAASGSRRRRLQREDGAYREPPLGVWGASPQSVRASELKAWAASGALSP
jgi:hypothetical protein